MTKHIFYNGIAIESFEVNLPIKTNKVRQGKQPRNRFGEYQSYNAKPIARATRKKKQTNPYVFAIGFAFILAGWVHYIHQITR